MTRIRHDDVVRAAQMISLQGVKSGPNQKLQQHFPLSPLHLHTGDSGCNIR